MSEEHILTPEQIKNWRKVLFNLIGPYAIIMPDEEVQRIRDKMQDAVNILHDDGIVRRGVSLPKKKPAQKRTGCATPSD